MSTNSTQRLITALTGDDPCQVLGFNVLLSYLIHLKQTKGATFDSIHTILNVAYMNVPEAEHDTLNTHLKGE